VSTWFQGLFHPPLGVLFTFPSRYWFTIGRISSLALEGGPPSFPPDFACPVVLRIPTHTSPLLPTSLSLSLERLSSRFGWKRRVQMPGPTTPSVSKYARFGLPPFRSPLLWGSRLISSGQATEMFQFAHFPLPPLCVQGGVSRHHSRGVAPFGVSRLIACMQLPLNVSPVSASFFGLMRLGIHLVLSLACYTGVFTHMRSSKSCASSRALPLFLKTLCSRHN
jgi:hypothetical protein